MNKKLNKAMKKQILKCEKCGYVECLDFTDYDGAFIIPVKFAKTIQQVGKVYKQIMGNTYFETTGEKLSKIFFKKKIELTHLPLEEYSSDAHKQHTLGKILCWTDL